MADDVMYLVTETLTQDAYGVFQRTETERKVFCKVTSIGSREWFDGGRNGLNPELRFIVFRYDYDGEKIVKFHGDYFTIYRTFIRDDNIELYTERRQGNADTHI